jgi:putative addiction module component (TIGR02574 family)
MKIHDLTLEERVKLVEDIWDSIAAEQEALPITPEQRRELDRRLERYRVDGDRGAPAAESIERIRKGL